MSGRNNDEARVELQEDDAQDRGPNSNSLEVLRGASCWGGRLAEADPQGVLGKWIDKSTPFLIDTEQDRSSALEGPR